VRGRPKGGLDVSGETANYARERPRRRRARDEHRSERSERGAQSVGEACGRPRCRAVWSWCLRERSERRLRRACSPGGLKGRGPVGGAPATPSTTGMNGVSDEERSERRRHERAEGFPPSLFTPSSKEKHGERVEGFLPSLFARLTTEKPRSGGQGRATDHATHRRRRRSRHVHTPIQTPYQTRLAPRRRAFTFASSIERYD